jgi:hypothetical protein
MARKESALIELTEQQQHALDAGPAPRLIDPRTQKEYVLIGADQFERLRGLVTDDGPDMRQVSILVDQAMRDDDAGDPTLAFYQQRYGTQP